MAAWAPGAWATGAWAGTAWAGAVVEEETNTGGFPPLRRDKRITEPELIQIIEAFLDKIA